MPASILTCVKGKQGPSAQAQAFFPFFQHKNGFIVALFYEPILFGFLPILPSPSTRKGFLVKWRDWQEVLNLIL
ncbi:MAG: hypothetical protein D6772_15990 [Bacteroidetes bacterium]|nr:MAG: hypothetical protein D6772_15990 [Bacteroidota bacterium]